MGVRKEEGGGSLAMLALGVGSGRILGAVDCESEGSARDLLEGDAVG